MGIIFNWPEVSRSLKRVLLKTPMNVLSVARAAEIRDGDGVLFALAFLNDRTGDLRLDEGAEAKNDAAK